ncbi:S66 family peptidase [Nocardioides coralli]|uniref:S66 family peptidase n=1 Tax=Nocardioides coralli TaxID=2872154 RepID=UPI001CA40EA7|nr:S66 peptidase family protein [Nocardioides coralli]QZY28226.1 LD-carboxypeptidase [Nocardioides coralli]
MIRFPDPLRPGDRIGVTAPSSGVAGAETDRIDFCVRWLRERGFDVLVGECMDGSSHVSAPRERRAAELTAMLTDPAIRAVVPPWGGETAIDLVDLIDYDAVAAAEPTWVVGYSDSSTWLTPLLLRAGLASIHGDNLADTPYTAPDGLVHWLDLAAATGPVTQRDSGLVATWVRFEEDATATRWRPRGTGSWEVLGGGAVDVTGRLVGGCLETMGPIAGTPYGDVRAFGREHGPLVVYLEVAEDDAFSACRQLHGLRLAGWFEHAVAVLIGRTSAPAGVGGFTQRDAVADAIGDLGLPVVLDLEIGHVPPHLPLVNGALARVVVDGDRRELTQEWR